MSRVQPIDYYGVHDDGPACSLSEVKKKIKTIEAYATRHELQVFWRGQANHEWGLTSSLARQLASATVVDDDLLNASEDGLLEEAEEWIAELSGKGFKTPLARLAYMQHHGIPTRLIDFTRNAWMAVFFAAESDANDHVDGRIFALLVKKTGVIGKPPEDKPWQKKYGSDAIKVWDPAAAGITFPRLKAQDGVFALGRLPSTNPRRQALDVEAHRRKRDLLAEEVRRIMSVPFRLGRLDRLPKDGDAPIGFTFRVHVDKESVRQDLAGRSGRRISPKELTVTARKVYPDAVGMVAHSRFLRGLSRGVFILKPSKE